MVRRPRAACSRRRSATVSRSASPTRSSDVVELAMEPERDVVGQARPRDLAERLRVEHEQERAALAAVEHDAEQHAVAFGLAVRRRNVDRLARMAAVLLPGL